MRLTNEGARTYFNQVPRQWDAIYSHENRVKYAVNRLLRRGVFERHELTFKKCGTIAGATVLDLGCGTGRYSIEFAKRGAAKVVGVDFAPSMISFSQSIAEQMNVSDKCEFICGDILKVLPDRSFDIVAALGLFDYLADPESVIRRISGLTSGVFVASFPSYGLLGRLQRGFRYKLVKGCSIYQYRQDRIEKMIGPYFPKFEILPFSSGLFLTARKT